MILKAIPIEREGKRFYDMAPVESVTVDEDGIESTVVDYYTIPADTRTIFAGTDGVHDFFTHNPDTPEISERLKSSYSYRSEDMKTFEFQYPEEAAYCVTVSYGEVDTEGNRATKTLAEFDGAGMDRADIVRALPAACYFVAAS